MKSMVKHLQEDQCKLISYNYLRLASLIRDEWDRDWMAWKGHVEGSVTKGHTDHYYLARVCS